MEKNFLLGQSNELIKDGKIYDIHTCFDLEKFVLRGSDAEIVFRPNSVYGLGHPTIKLDIQNLDYLEVSPNFRAESVTDIDEVGYKQRDDRDDNWLLTESQSKGVGDLFFRFHGGHFIRFHGSRVDLNEL
jgi:hypothetical protein